MLKYDIFINMNFLTKEVDIPNILDILHLFRSVSFIFGLDDILKLIYSNKKIKQILNHIKIDTLDITNINILRQLYIFDQIIVNNLFFNPNQTINMNYFLKKFHLLII